VIRPPHRSVTRFFVPLIDVLILLFCIFLLMPYVAPAEPDDAASGDVKAPRSGASDDVLNLRRDLDQSQRERDALRNRLDTVLKQLTVRVLEIDKDTGRLYYHAPARTEIASEADALQLIARDRRSAAGRELYFLFLLPREVSGYPLQRQMDAYRRWFRDVPYGFDNPRGRR
jgi:hypothetical protein